MEVKSKYNIGDTIYYMDNQFPYKATVGGITFFVGEKKDASGTRYATVNDSCSILYHLKEYSKSIDEVKTCATKEELIQKTFENL